MQARSLLLLAVVLLLLMGAVPAATAQLPAPNVAVKADDESVGMPLNPGREYAVEILVTHHRPAGSLCNDPEPIDLRLFHHVNVSVHFTEPRIDVEPWGPGAATSHSYQTTLLLSIAPDQNALTVLPVHVLAKGGGCHWPQADANDADTTFFVRSAFVPHVEYVTVGLEPMVDNRTFTWTIQAQNHGNGDTKLHIEAADDNQAALLGPSRPAPVGGARFWSAHDTATFDVMVQGSHDHPVKASLLLTASYGGPGTSQRTAETILGTTLPALPAPVADAGSQADAAKDADPKATVPAPGLAPLLLAACAAVLLLARRRL